MDDDEDVRFLVEIILGKLGFQVVFALKGDEAVELYRDALQSGKKYAAAILDLNIPGSTGGEKVAAAILALDEQARLFVTSGNEHDPVMVDYRRYGFAGSLAKPFLYADAAKLIQQIP
jgi:CheY-like chemotaxis protein